MKTYDKSEYNTEKARLTGFLAIVLFVLMLSILFFGFYVRADIREERSVIYPDIFNEETMFVPSQAGEMENLVEKMQIILMVSPDTTSRTNLPE